MNWVSNKIFWYRIESLCRISCLLLLLLCIACNSTTEETDHAGHTLNEHANHTASASDTSLADIVRSVNQMVVSSQETVMPVVKAPGNLLALNGYITEDPRRNQTVASRVGGRIENLYVKYNYQYIRKGEKVLDLYSPNLRTSQEEYLYLLKSSKDSNLLSSARKKLLLLGLSENQITRLEQKKEVSLTISIYSSYSGYVSLNSSSPVIAGYSGQKVAEGMRMGGGTSTAETAIAQTGNELREGAYVNAGQTLFTINDFKKVWALLAVDAENQSFLQVNTPVKVISEVTPETPIEGKIDLVEPVYKEGIQFMQARVYLDNAGELLKANSLVMAEIESGEGAVMMVPTSSIADLGSRKIVWVKVKDTPSGKKVFEPRTVLTGIRGGEFTQIINGLEKNDVIAKQAGYLVDSESMID